MLCVSSPSRPILPHVNQCNVLARHPEASRCQIDGSSISKFPTQFPSYADQTQDIPDDQLHELLPVAAKIARAAGSEQYNILQNNGRMAHQVVDHVHFHFIPKPNEQEGLGISWPQQSPGMEKLQQLLEDIKAKM
jgi:hypothetical protein